MNSKVKDGGRKSAILPFELKSDYEVKSNC